MLDDRHYMRPEYRPRSAFGLNISFTTLLVIILIVCYALQHIDIAYFRGAHLSYFALSNEALRSGYVWTLITFQFMHGGHLHIIFNLIGLWLFGRSVEERLGKIHFTVLYLMSGITGGALESLLSWLFPNHFSGGVIGASAGVMALIAVFALMEPEALILFMYVLPMRAKYLLHVETAIALFFTLVPSDPGIAHSAHLGGIIFGVGYMKWGLNLSYRWAEWNPFHRKMRRERMIKAATVKPSLAKLRRRPSAGEAPELPSEEFISSQVDPILDKISAHGIQSLTERERAILQAARAKMSKR